MASLTSSQSWVPHLENPLAVSFLKISLKFCHVSLKNIFSCIPISRAAVGGSTQSYYRSYCLSLRGWDPAPPPLNSQFLDGLFVPSHRGRWRGKYVVDGYLELNSWSAWQFGLKKWFLGFPIHIDSSSYGKGRMFPLCRLSSGGCVSPAGTSSFLDRECRLRIAVAWAPLALSLNEYFDITHVFQNCP